MILFSEGDFSDQLTMIRRKALDIINSWSEEVVLNTEVDELVEILAKSHMLPTLEFQELKISRDSYSRTEAPVNMNRIEKMVESKRLIDQKLDIFELSIELPSDRAGRLRFSADKDSTAQIKATLEIPSAVEFRQYGPQEVFLEPTARVTICYIIRPDDEDDAIKVEVDQTLAEIERQLQLQSEAVQRHNSDIRVWLKSKIIERKESIERRLRIAEASEIPLREREGSEHFAPIERVPIELTVSELVDSKPDHPIDYYYSLTQDQFQDVLRTLDRMGEVAERCPDVFAGLLEEHIRTLFLVVLNGRYQVLATAETFNVAGKLDICLNVGTHTVFIAECKNWAGPRTVTKCIDQIQKYACVRDTHAAILLFIRESHEPSKVRLDAHEQVRSHDSTRTTSPVGGRWITSEHSHPRDSGGTMTLATMVFDLRPSEKKSKRMRTPRKR